MSLILKNIEKFITENPNVNITSKIINDIIKNVELNKSKKKKQKPFGKKKQIQEEELYRDFCDF